VELHLADMGTSSKELLGQTGLKFSIRKSREENRKQNDKNNYVFLCTVLEWKNLRAECTVIIFRTS